MKKFLKLAPALLVGIALVAMLVGFGPVGAPPAATPNSFTVFNQAVLITSTNSAAQAWRSSFVDPDGAEAYWSITQGSPTNAITMTVQHSYDGKNWIDDKTILSNSTSTTYGFTTTTVYGLKARVVATLANTNPVTVSAWLLVH